SVAKWLPGRSLLVGRRYPDGRGPTVTASGRPEKCLSPLVRAPYDRRDSGVKIPGSTIGGLLHKGAIAATSRMRQRGVTGPPEAPKIPSTTPLRTTDSGHDLAFGQRRSGCVAAHTILSTGRSHAGGTAVLAGMLCARLRRLTGPGRCGEPGRTRPVL